MPFDTVCFHAQQCVEKYLKSWLVFRCMNVPRSHDFVILLNLAMPTGLQGDSWVEFLDELFRRRVPASQVTLQELVKEL
jgi:HEPN domain-containing protein